MGKKKHIEENCSPFFKGSKEDLERQEQELHINLVAASLREEPENDIDENCSPFFRGDDYGTGEE